jgi:hypothetical protein
MTLKNLSKDKLLEYIRKMHDGSFSDTSHVSEIDQGYDSSDDSDDRGFVDENEEESEPNRVSSVRPDSRLPQTELTLV